MTTVACLYLLQQHQVAMTTVTSLYTCSCLDAVFGAWCSGTQFGEDKHQCPSFCAGILSEHSFPIRQQLPVSCLSKRYVVLNVVCVCSQYVRLVGRLVTSEG